MTLIVIATTQFYVWDSPGAAYNNIHGWGSYRHDNLNSGIFYDMSDGVLYDEDVYVTGITTTSISSNNINRYYFGRNVFVGENVINNSNIPTNVPSQDLPLLTPSNTTFSPGAVTFGGTNPTVTNPVIIIEGTKSVLLQGNVLIPLGVNFQIK